MVGAFLLTILATAKLIHATRPAGQTPTTDHLALPAKLADSAPVRFCLGLLVA